MTCPHFADARRGGARPGNTWAAPAAAHGGTDLPHSLPGIALHAAFAKSERSRTVVCGELRNDPRPVAHTQYTRLGLFSF